MSSSESPLTPDDRKPDRYNSLMREVSKEKPATVSDIFGSVDFGSAKRRELAGLGPDVLGKVEFMQIDDAAIARGPIVTRGALDNLCYGTGTTYLLGLSAGTVWGLKEAIGGRESNLKLRINTVLNKVTRRGPLLGNSCGILAMGYNSINGIIGNFRGRHDIVNSIAAGALVGALFKSTAGIRKATTASAICAVAAAGWSLTRRWMYK